MLQGEQDNDNLTWFARDWLEQQVIPICEELMRDVLKNLGEVFCIQHLFFIAGCDKKFIILIADGCNFECEW